MPPVDVVVIGAGIIGLSVAYYLLADASLRVLVVDQAPLPGTGSTARATGGIRHQFSSEALIRLTLISVREYRRLAEELHFDPEMDLVGYLFVTGDRARYHLLEESRLLQNRLGVPTEHLTAGEIGEHFPFVATGDLLGGTFCAADGSANPYPIVQGLVQAIRSRGGQLLLGHEVVGLHVDRGRVTGVRTAGESIACGAVVNAAGAAAREVGALAGVEIPVWPFRRQVAVLTAVDLGRPPIPVLVDFDSGWYLHRLRDGAILLGGTDRDSRPGVETVSDEGTTEKQIEAGLHRVPALQAAKLTRTYVGLRPLTPDDHPILGPAPGVEGFYCACGLGGHGFMHAPAVGMLVAESVRGGRWSEFDPRDLSLGRFRDRVPSPEQLRF